MQVRLQRCLDQWKRDEKTLTALNDALSAHTTRPPSPPASPRTLPPDYILQFIEEPLLESIRSNIEPLVEEFRSNIGEMLRAHSTEVYETLWAKLGLTMRLVETVSAQFTNGD